jgi:hypothetical protein
LREAAYINPDREAKLERQRAVEVAVIDVVGPRLVVSHASPTQCLPFKNQDQNYGSWIDLSPAAIPPSIYGFPEYLLKH